MQNKHFQRGGYGDRGADLGSTGYPEVRSFTEKHRSHRESKSNQNQDQNQIRSKPKSNTTCSIEAPYIRRVDNFKAILNQIRKHRKKNFQIKDFEQKSHFPRVKKCITILKG